MPGVCSELILIGKCTRVVCPFKHDLSLFCRQCSYSSYTPSQAKHHKKTKEHKEISRRCAAYCKLCYEPLGGGEAAWGNHCKSERHQAAALRSPDWFDPPFPSYKETTTPAEGHVRCEICHADVLHEEWESHVGLAAHRIKWLMTVVPRRVVQRMLRETSRDALVTVSHTQGLDFGIVDVGVRNRGTTIQKGLTLTVHSGSIRIESARITSSIDGTDADSATFATNVRSRDLKRGERISVNVSFTAGRQVGSFVDRVELQFIDTRSDYQFVIWRAVRGEVGDREQLEALKPVSEYVPPPRSYAHLGEEEELKTRGKPFEDPFRVRWGGSQLPEFKIPPELAKVLKENPKGCTNMIARDFMPKTLTLDTYGQYWQVLLHVEEAQQTLDLKVYSQEDVHVTKKGKLYDLHVEGLIEKRPSVVVGDLIKIKLHTQTKVVHGGYVHRVQDKIVRLSLHQEFTYGPRLKYDVEFTLNRIPFRRQHQAVLSKVPDRRRILFPNWGDLRGATARTGDPHFVPFNRKVLGNVPQQVAVDRILNMPPGSPPFIIYGPFGTGKTTTLVEAILQLRQAKEGVRILACAPSNAAADNIGIRLQQSGITKSDMLRLNSATREYDPLPLDIQAFHDEFSLTGDAEVDGGNSTRFRLPEKYQLMGYGVVVSTCVAGGIPLGLGVPRGHFDWIFVDEAGQASEPEVCVPILTMMDHKTNVVLCGDPMQLDPIIHSHVSKSLGHGTSLLARLMGSKDEMYHETGTKGQKGLTVVKLVHNFRNHKSILDFPNKHMYSNELIASANPMITQKLLRWDGFPNPNFPVLFHGVIGNDKREGRSPSYFNPHEVLQVRHYVDDLLKSRVLNIKGSDIGVIAPYSAQCSKIRQMMQGALYKDVKVGSVEEFQGQERTVIIISTTRSSSDQVAYDLRHTLGFVASPRRLNVAMTRAQAGLVIIGNPKILSLDPLWRALINYIHINGGYKAEDRRARLDWNPREDVNFADEGFYARSRTEQAMGRMDALERRIRGLVLSGRGPNDEEEEDGDEVVFVSGYETRSGWRDNV